MARSELAMFALRRQRSRMRSAMSVDRGIGWETAVSHIEQVSQEGSKEGFGHLDLGNKPGSLGTNEYKSLGRGGSADRERVPGAWMGSPELSAEGWCGEWCRQCEVRCMQRAEQLYFK